MNITITLTWWLLPLAVTLIVFLLARISCSRNSGRRGDWDLLGGFYELVTYGAATVASLVVWLVYALAT